MEKEEEQKYKIQHISEPTFSRDIFVDMIC